MTARAETTAEWLLLWQQALTSPSGIYIRAINAEDLINIRQYLYAARRSSGDPTLNTLQVRTSISSPLNELWIVKP